MWGRGGAATHLLGGSRRLAGRPRVPAAIEVLLAASQCGPAVGTAAQGSAPTVPELRKSSRSKVHCSEGRCSCKLWAGGAGEGGVGV